MPTQSHKSLFILAQRHNVRHGDRNPQIFGHVSTLQTVETAGKCGRSWMRLATVLHVPTLKTAANRASNLVHVGMDNVVVCDPVPVWPTICDSVLVWPTICGFGPIWETICIPHKLWPSYVYQMPATHRILQPNHLPALETQALTTKFVS